MSLDSHLPKKVNRTKRKCLDSGPENMNKTKLKDLKPAIEFYRNDKKNQMKTF